MTNSDIDWIVERVSSESSISLAKKILSDINKFESTDFAFNPFFFGTVDGIALSFFEGFPKMLCTPLGGINLFQKRSSIGKGDWLDWLKANNFSQKIFSHTEHLNNIEVVSCDPNCIFRAIRVDRMGNLVSEPSFWEGNFRTISDFQDIRKDFSFLERIIPEYILSQEADSDPENMQRIVIACREKLFEELWEKQIF